MLYINIFYGWYIYMQEIKKPKSRKPKPKKPKPKEIVLQVERNIIIEFP